MNRACHIVRTTETLVMITIMIVTTDEEPRPGAVKTITEVTRPEQTGAAPGSKPQILPLPGSLLSAGSGGPSTATVHIPCRLPHIDRERPVLPAPQAGLDQSPSCCPPKHPVFSLSCVLGQPDSWEAGVRPFPHSVLGGECEGVSLRALGLGQSWSSCPIWGTALPGCSLSS